jgi:hypothetical protein
MVPMSAIGHDGKPIQQILVTLVTSIQLSQSNSHTNIDAKNVRECNDPTVQLCAYASVTIFPRWINTVCKRRLPVILCVWTLGQVRGFDRLWNLLSCNTYDAYNSCRSVKYGYQKIRCTVVPPYPRVIRSKTHRGYVKLRIIQNAIHNVICM